jgi:hypothetical protein
VSKADLRRDNAGFLLVHNGYFNKAWQGKMTLRLTCRGGAWSSVVSGSAPAYNLGLHWGEVHASGSGVKIALQVKLKIQDERLGGAGGEAEYAIELARQGDALSGTYTGRFTGGPGPKVEGTAKSIEVKGTAAGRISPHWPVPLKDRTRFVPGELLRKGDLSRLRERSATPEEQTLIRKLREQLAFDKQGKFGWGKMYKEWAPACRCTRPWRS